MADIELVIKIPEEMYDWFENGFPDEVDAENLWQIVKSGTPLPKGHGRLIDGNCLKGILKCEEYDTCIWRNCSECEYNREKHKTGYWINDKCSECGKGTENLIDSPEWYRNEEPNFCPFCGLKLVKPQAEKEDRK